MYSLSVSDEDMNGNSHAAFDDAPDIQLSYPGEDGDTRWTCSECGETAEEEPAAYAEGEPIPLDDQCPHAECETCEGVGQIWPEGTTDFQATPSTDCPQCETGGHGAHEWQAEPHAWLNSARISTGDDTVTVAISVGDPRGAFVMRLERLSDGELRLSVPTPADAMAHMGLVPLGSPGYFKIVASESPEHQAARKAAREV